MINKKYIGMLFLLMSFWAVEKLYAADSNFSILANVGQRYDDNITYAQKDKKSDFITVSDISLDLAYQTRRSLADINIVFTDNHYWKYTENNNIAKYATVNLIHELSKTDMIKISDSLRHAYELQGFEAEFERFRDLYSTTSNQFDIAYTKTFSEKLQTQFGYGYDLDLTSRDDILDSYAHRGFFEGTYAFNSKNMIFGQYNYLTRELDPGSKASINTFSAGFRKFLTQQMSFELIAGIDKIDSYISSKLTKPSFSAKLKEQVSEKTSLDVSLSKSYSTNPYTEDVFNSWRVSVGMYSQLSRKLTASSDIFFGKGKYETFLIEDDLVGFRLGLNYELKKDWAAKLLYSHSATASNLDSREYTKNVFFLGLNRQF